METKQENGSLIYVKEATDDATETKATEEDNNQENVDEIDANIPPPKEDKEEQKILENLEGYREYLSPLVKFIPPPKEEDDEEEIPEEIDKRVIMTEEEARDALVEYVASQCCYGDDTAKNMTLTKINHTTAFHYELKSFIESRNSEWSHLPYHGGHVDGPDEGTAPKPWDISVETPPNFEDKELEVEVPHTSTIKSCNKCQGLGNIKCSSCQGNGTIQCSTCNGKGNTGTGDDKIICFFCKGQGRKSCGNCKGDGRLACKNCEQSGKVRNFILLTVRFETKDSDYILEHTELPDHLIRDVAAPILFDDTQHHVQPVHTFPVDVVCVNSKRLIIEHKAYGKTGKILVQHHQIRGVPVFQCDYAWEDKLGTYFVYGDNRKVYAAYYPQSCCWGKCPLCPNSCQLL